VIFEYDGQPVFQDGVNVGGKDPWQFPPDKVLDQLPGSERRRYESYMNQSFVGYDSTNKMILMVSPGLLGAANAVVVDEIPWYWPGGLRVGVPEFYGSRDGLQVVTADCANYYQPTYDVRQARRTSMWTDDGFGLILDTLRADSDHTWRWQVHLRPDVQVVGDSARVNLPDDKSVILAWEPTVEVRTEQVDGFPKTHEARSCRLDLIKKGSDARFVVVVAPEAQSVSVRCVDDHVLEVTIDEKTHRMVVENFDTEQPAFAWEAPGRAVVEITGTVMKDTRQDAHFLSDIHVDRDLQFPQIENLIRWTAPPVAPGDTRLSQVDACIAQMAAEDPDVSDLLAALRGPHWPIQVAAAEVLGRRGCKQAVPAIRQLLAAEHAIPKEQMYPPVDGQPHEGQSIEDTAKRWRLKAALITALGRLGDVDCVPLLGQILTDARDFYVVYSIAAQALGRIGGPKALDALTPALEENEPNTRARALAAKAALQADEG